MSPAVARDLPLRGHNLACIRGGLGDERRGFDAGRRARACREATVVGAAPEHRPDCCWAVC